MLKLQKYFITFVLLFGLLEISAQQLQNGTQYLVNPYSLSPTLAGYSGYSEATLNYRNNWSKITGSPQTFSASGAGNVYKQKMWLGGEILGDKTDILSLIKINLSYTYKLQVENNQHLYFGIWTTLYQASVNIGDGIGVDPNDPVIQNKSKLNSTAINAGFGINYSWRNFNLGISLPALFAPSDKYETNSAFKYRVERQFQFYMSNLFRFNDTWQLQAYGVFQKTTDVPINVEISAMGIYLGRVWSGLLYRNGGALAVNIGGHIYRGLVFNYSYDIGTGGINKGSGGSHQITVGYRFNFFGNNYFSTNETTSSRRRGRRSGNISYPEVQDYKLRKD